MQKDEITRICILATWGLVPYDFWLSMVIRFFPTASRLHAKKITPFVEVAHIATVKQFVSDCYF